MPDSAFSIFISYSREDSEFVVGLAQHLKAAGVNVWFDQPGIKVGTDWDIVIEDAIRDASRMLIVLSPASVKSKNVRNEIAYAIDLHKVMIPVLYKDCDTPISLYRTQRIDLRSDYKRGLSQILDHLRDARPNPLGPQEHSENEAQIFHAVTNDQSREEIESALQVQQSRTRGAVAREAEQVRLKEADERKAEEESERKKQAAKAVRLKQRERLERRRLEQEEISKRQALEVAEALRLRETEQHEALIRKRQREEMESIALPKEAIPSQESDNSSPHGKRIVWPPGETLLATAAAVRPPSPASSAATCSNWRVKAPIHDPVSIPIQPLTQSTPNIVPKPNPVGTDWKSKRSLSEEIKEIPHLKEVASAIATVIALVCLGVGAVWGFFAYENRPSVRLEKAQKSCDGGSAFYCGLLGDVYYSGNADYVAGKDVPKAVTLFQRACDGGALWSCVQLGNLYGNGVAVPRDMRQAASLWQKACDGNDYVGCENLGILYEAGSGVDKNLSISKGLFQKACSHVNTWFTTKSCDELKKPQFQ